MKRFSLGAASGLVGSLVLTVGVQAAGFLKGDNLNKVASGSGVPQIAGSQLPQVIASIIGIITGLLGIVLFGYILLAGYTWMTAGGDEKKIIEAKSMIKNAVIGLVLVGLSYTIANFVITTLNSDVFGPAGGTTGEGVTKGS